MQMSLGSECTADIDWHWLWVQWGPQSREAMELKAPLTRELLSVSPLGPRSIALPCQHHTDFPEAEEHACMIAILLCAHAPRRRACEEKGPFHVPKPKSGTLSGA